MFISLDLETTGLSARYNKIIEVGAVKYDDDGTRLDTYLTLVKPGMHSVPPKVTEITGLDDGDLEGAPPFLYVADAIAAFLAPGPDGLPPVVVAHNAAFDASFLAAEYANIRRPPPPARFCCTARLAKLHRYNATYPKLALQRGMIGLTRLAEALGIAADEISIHSYMEKHRALVDAEIAARAWVLLGGPSSMDRLAPVPYGR